MGNLPLLEPTAQAGEHLADEHLACERVLVDEKHRVALELAEGDPVLERFLLRRGEVGRIRATQDAHEPRARDGAGDAGALLRLLEAPDYSFFASAVGLPRAMSIAASSTVDHTSGA